MRTNKTFKGILAGILAVAMAASVSLYAFADTTNTDTTGTGNVTGNVEIDGSIIPLTISVTHPTVVAYTINANSGTFTANPVSVTNNSRVPINIAVASLKSTSGGSIQFTDVLPTAENWAGLDTTDTKTYIALGIGITDATGWGTGYSTATDWAAADTSTAFGQLASAKTGNLALTADYGLAWDGNYTAKHELNFLFSLV